MTFSSAEPPEFLDLRSTTRAAFDATGMNALCFRLVLRYFFHLHFPGRESSSPTGWTVLFAVRCAPHTYPAMFLLEAIAGLPYQPRCQQLGPQSD